MHTNDKRDLIFHSGGTDYRERPERVAGAARMIVLDRASVHQPRARQISIDIRRASHIPRTICKTIRLASCAVHCCADASARMHLGVSLRIPSLPHCFSREREFICTAAVTSDLRDTVREPRREINGYVNRRLATPTIRRRDGRRRAKTRDRRIGDALLGQVQPSNEAILEPRAGRPAYEERAPSPLSSPSFPLSPPSLRHDRRRARERDSFARNKNARTLGEAFSHRRRKTHSRPHGGGGGERVTRWARRGRGHA